MLNLPQLRNNPVLFQAIKNYLADHASISIKLSPAADGTLTAQLLFPTTNALAAKPTAPTPPSLATLIGQNIQAIILPSTAAAGTATPSATPPPTTTTDKNPTVPAQPPPTNITTGLNRLPEKLEQWLRPLLPLRTAPPPTPAPITAPDAPAATLSPTQPLLQVRLQKIIPAGQPLPPIQADEVLATTTPNKNIPTQPLVTVGNTTLLLKTDRPAPAGSTLLLKLLPPTLTEQHERTLSSTTRPWSSLQELINTINQQDMPAALQNWAQHHLPQNNAALPGALLLLMSAFRQNDARVWLGKSVTHALEQSGKQAVLESIQNELTQSISHTNDPVVGDWRVYQLPLFDQGEMHPLQLYVHHNQQQHPTDPDEAAAEQTRHKKQTRFVIDVTFTQLGALQLDGFVQTQQFDLMLRSDQPLTPALRDELRTSFADTLAATGYHGQLTFQIGQQHWLHLAPQPHDDRKI